MITILFIITSISLIGVGLPDSVLGTAWPIMYRELDVSISLAGYITAAVSAGTIVSSFMSSWLIQKLGTGLLTAISTLLTAIALLGFALTEHVAYFFILAIPLGIGAGAVDTALNSFAALHYTASQMSYLHCFYGLGVTISPLVMSLALGDSENWRRGYVIVATLQFVITAVTFAALPLWNKVREKDAEGKAVQVKILSLIELIKTPGVLCSAFALFMACALELTAGSWSSSFFVNTKGVPADRAARIAMLFYIGLAGGRFLSGLFAGKLGRRGILRISIIILLAAIIGFMLPFSTAVAAVSLFFIGLGIGPVFPNLSHLTPQNFGESIAQSVMGFQQAMTYIGIMIMPWLFGVLAGRFSTALLPYYLLVLGILYTSLFIWLMRIVKRTERQNV